MIGMCGRCYDDNVEIVAPNCNERCETQVNLGMYHCPDCGAMVLGGIEHPWLCVPCVERRHPAFDEV